MGEKKPTKEELDAEKAKAKAAEEAKDKAAQIEKSKKFKSWHEAVKYYQEKEKMSFAAAYAHCDKYHAHLAD